MKVKIRPFVLLFVKIYEVEFFNPHFRTIMSSLFFFDTLIFDSFTVYLSKKKQITSYLDDDEKASVLEKGHLPVKEMNQKISLYFAGARFAFAP